MNDNELKYFEDPPLSIRCLSGDLNDFAQVNRPQSRSQEEQDGHLSKHLFHVNEGRIVQE